MSDKHSINTMGIPRTELAEIVGKLSHRLEVFIYQKLKDVYLSSEQKAVNWRV